MFFNFFNLFHIFHIFTVCETPISENNSLMTPFFTLFVLSRASDKHYFSKYWGDGCMGRPPIQIFEGTFPSDPLGVRPCRELMSKPLSARFSRPLRSADRCDLLVP